MGKAITKWKRDLIALIALLMLGVLAPVATVVLLAAFIILPMALMGFNLEFWDHNVHNIAFVAIVLLGPYFIGEKWDDICDIISKFNQATSI